MPSQLQYNNSSYNLFNNPQKDERMVCRVEDDEHSQLSCPSVQSSYDSSSCIRSRVSSEDSIDVNITQSRPHLPLPPKLFTANVNHESSCVHPITPLNRSEYDISDGGKEEKETEPLISICDKKGETKENHSKLNKRKHEKNKGKGSDNMSWLRHTFCALPTMTPFDLSIDYDDERSYHEDVCHAPYEGRNLVDVIDYDEADINESSDCINFQNNNIICSSWQGWDDDDETMSQLQTMNIICDKNHNSSKNKNVKKERMEKLVFHMNPFDRKSSPIGDPIKLAKKTNSLPQKPIKTFKKSLSEYESCEWHANVVAACGTFSPAQEIEVISSSNKSYNQRDDQEECLCYDSDPGILVSRCHSSKGRKDIKPKRFSERRVSSIGYDYDIDDFECMEMVSVDKAKENRHYFID